MTDIFTMLEETMGEDLLAYYLVIWGIVLAFMLITGIVRYVLKGISLYTICRRRGLKARGLSWVPYGSTWICGSIADHYDRETKGRDRNYRTWLLIGDVVLTIAMFAALAVFLIGSIEGANAAMTSELTDPGINSGTVTGLIAIYVLMIPVFVLQVFAYIVQYKIYRSCSPKASGWLLALAIVFNFGGLESAIPLFCLRNKDDGFIPQDPAEAEREQKRLEMYN